MNWEEELGMANTKDIVEHRGPQLTASFSEIRLDLGLFRRSLSLWVRIGLRLVAHRGLAQSVYIDEGGCQWVRAQEKRILSFQSPTMDRMVKNYQKLIQEPRASFQA